MSELLYAIGPGGVFFGFMGWAHFLFFCLYYLLMGHNSTKDVLSVIIFLAVITTLIFAGVYWLNIDVAASSILDWRFVPRV